ncbi:hypothetical protein Pint_32103 [Pistacia integerrima]|uniref:Uncharacterized protein n=2 Tax=Pistacia integerrima TaxID=434235 RepID=A0ACC0XPV6_9ROSI|nr:hypothetical protein Pint_21402 [Pistacia integerrima]KAJ0020284.1 hypothetical protein Pint_32103 [Pistacia integerrima]
MVQVFLLPTLVLYESPLL